MQVDLDVASQRVGHWAELGRLLDHTLEPVRTETRHLCADVEVDRRDSRRPFTSSSVQAALTVTRSGGVLFSPSTSASAMAKQLACAAAISSSGLVLPSGRSVRDAQVTGTSNAPLAASSAPVPLASVPRHTTSASRRAIGIVSSFDRGD